MTLERGTCWQAPGEARSLFYQGEEHRMCLGVPGRVLEVFERDDLPMGRIEFGGIVKEACLAYTPEAEPGDYVLVHVGFSISRIDQQEADEIFRYLDEIHAAGLSEEPAAVDPESTGSTNSPPDGDSP